MELRYPLVIFIIIFLIICYFILVKKKDNKFINGSKIANTHYIKNTDYYKKKIKEFRIIKYTLFSLFSLAIIAAAILISRLAKIDTNNIDQYNRDIFLCMDASASVDELNTELIENLKTTIDKLHGERFGISIFNTTSVVLVPLTDDYDYVKEILDMVKKSIAANNDYNFDSYLDNEYFYIRNYINSGTLEDNDTRGSSLIGDGLASCAYSFSNPEEDRTRIIIFSTDNELAGTPLVSLEKAAKISKTRGIKVFGIGTKEMRSQDRIELKNAVESTGGKYYEHSNSTVNSIVEDIEATSKTLLQNQYETKKIDIPQIPFIILIVSVIGIVIISKKVTS